MRTGPLIRRLLMTFTICLAPVVVDVETRYTRGLWMIPAGILPFFLLGEHWPTAWALLSVAIYGGVVGWLWRLVRNSTPQDGWRRVGVLAWLSSIGPVLIGASIAPVVSQLPVGILAISWAGSAAIGWGALVFYLTIGSTADAQIKVWLLRLWLVCTVAVGVWAFLFGSLAGLCC